MRVLTAIPIYNEERHLESVIREAWRYCPYLLVINDGSTDGTAALLERLVGECRDADDRSLDVVTHPQNRGYGAALISAFAHALAGKVDVLVTMDCDGQHEPARIPVLTEALHGVSIVSGSRYLRDFRQDDAPPADRWQINQRITQELNERCGLNLTDGFCGFKAYCRTALRQLEITETGWGMPLQLWVQAAYLGLRIREVGVPRIYLDPNRAFGGVLNDADQRRKYYCGVIAEAERCMRDVRGLSLPTTLPPALPCSELSKESRR